MFFSGQALSITDYDAMRIQGISLNGPDPLPQQLEELDAQSRLMCGMVVANQSSNGSSTSQKVKSEKVALT